MGVVYRARDQELSRDVAIKLVLTRAEPDEMHAARLAREAQALAQLAHPNVVAVYDVGRAEGGVFVAMELVAGMAGDAWLKEKPPWRDVLRVFRDAARGLAAAHAVGLIHRDFKPANLIVGDDGRVRVLDFGLARAAALGQATDEPAAPAADADATADSGERSPSLLDSPLTQAGTVVGTPPYMAPEQHLGRACDARSDQFSFCASFYRALYGERAFAGATFGELRDNILKGKVRPPPDSDVPGWLREIVLRGLAVDPDQRWPSMDAIIAALEHDPHARRRRLAAIGGAALLVIAAAGVATWRARRDPAQACRDGEQQLAGVWGAQRSAAVRAAFVKTGKPYAADAFATVTRALDDYTKRWVAMRSDACLATRVRGTQSAELLDLRMECLQRRLDDVRALVGVLAAADGDVVARAADAAAKLPPLDACADADGLRAPVRPPADPVTKARVAAAQRTLATVRALWIAGRYAEADKQLGPVVTEAHALGWRPLEGEALLAQARLVEETGDYPKSSQLYRDAAIAAEAGRDDETAALARNGLVWVTGERLGHYDEAQELAREAEATIERLGHRELLQADLDQKVAALLLEQGKYDEAEKRSRHVLEIRQKMLAPDDPAIASALGDLGDVASQTARYADAIGFYQRALAIAEHAEGADHPMCGSLRINLATALRGTGHDADALAQLERARAITERALGAAHPQLATIAVDIGNIELDDGRDAEAAAQFEKASQIWTRALGADHPNVATALYHLGQVELKQGHPSDAAANFQRALDIWQKRLGPDHPSLAAAFAGLGDAALARAHAADALVDYQRALAVLEKTFGPDHAALVDPLVSIGNAELALHDPRRATPPLERAVALATKGDDPADLAGARFALARALGAGGDPQRARTLATAAQQAFAAAGKDHAADAKQVADWLRTLPPSRR